MKFWLVFLCALASCVVACQKTETSSPPAQTTSNSADPAPDRKAAATTSRDQDGAVESRIKGVSRIVKTKFDFQQPMTEIEEKGAFPEPVCKERLNKSAVPADRQDRILVARFSAVQNGPPSGWVVDVKKGSHNFSVEREGSDLVLHMVSKNNSFGIKKEAQVNIREYPYMNWRWKTVRMPPGGDVRSANTDDQAIQLYLAFPAIGWPAALNSPVIGYVWDNESPRGYYGRCKQIGGDKLRYLVLRNKSDKVGEWHAEKRNVYQDYKTLFKDIKGGEPDAVTHGIQIHINSQHTGTEAESYIGEIYFSKS